MGEAAAFYRRWISVAFSGALDRAALMAFVILSLIDGSKHFFPKVGEVTESVVWAIPYWALAAVMVWRMLAAPFAMWKEDFAKAAKLEAKVAKLTAPSPIHPDGIYQFGRRVGTVRGAEERLGEGEVRFVALEGKEDFNAKAAFEYRDFLLMMTRSDSMSRVSMPGYSGSKYHAVVCKIFNRF